METASLYFMLSGGGWGAIQAQLKDSGSLNGRVRSV
jgi:hypothetical protein